MNPKELDNLLSISEAADVLDVPVSWLRAEAKAGRVPHLRYPSVNGQYLFDREAVAVALAGRDDLPTTEGPVYLPKGMEKRRAFEIELAFQCLIGTLRRQDKFDLSDYAPKYLEKLELLGVRVRFLKIQRPYRQPENRDNTPDLVGGTGGGGNG